MIQAGGIYIALVCFASLALGQTNLDADIARPESVHDLRPVAGLFRPLLWSLGGGLLIIAVVMIALRYRVSTNLYKTSSDAHWNEDSQLDAGEKVDAEEVDGACAVLEGTAGLREEEEAAAEATPAPQGRLFTPASGPAWGESMLKAFLRTCMKVNCLGRTWAETAARRSQSPDQPDPRETELIRRFMQRWQEFHVDPESGVFLERSSPGGRSRICIISVVKDKRTLAEAAFNAGFVIESLGRYLKSTDLVCRQALGNYHAPTREELGAMTPGEKESLIRITDIPDPWQAMIG